MMNETMNKRNENKNEIRKKFITCFFEVFFILFFIMLLKFAYGKYEPMNLYTVQKPFISGYRTYKIDILCGASRSVFAKLQNLKTIVCIWINTLNG